MSKPREFWIREHPEYDMFFAEESKQYDDDIHVIEKSAYDKAIEALKMTLEYWHLGDSDETNALMKAEEILKELGEIPNE